MLSSACASTIMLERRRERERGRSRPPHHMRTHVGQLFAFDSTGPGLGGWASTDIFFFVRMNRARGSSENRGPSRFAPGFGTEIISCHRDGSPLPPNWYQESGHVVVNDWLRAARFLFSSHVHWGWGGLLNSIVKCYTMVGDADVSVKNSSFSSPANRIIWQ